MAEYMYYVFCTISELLVDFLLVLMEHVSNKENVLTL